MLLLATERPDFIAFKMPQVEITHPLIHERGQLRSDANHQVYRRGPVDAGKSRDRSEGSTLDKQMEDGQLLLPRQETRHGKRLSLLWRVG